MSSNLIPLDDAETAMLIRESSTRAPLQLAFGSSGVALDADSSPWAVPLLKRWRAVDRQVAA